MQHFRLFTNLNLFQQALKKKSKTQLCLLCRFLSSPLATTTLLIVCRCNHQGSSLLKGHPSCSRQVLKVAPSAVCPPISTSYRSLLFFLEGKPCKKKQKKKLCVLRCDRSCIGCVLVKVLHQQDTFPQPFPMVGTFSGGESVSHGPQPSKAKSNGCNRCRWKHFKTFLSSIMRKGSSHR